MGYFDTVDIELFSIFNRESRNMYYDAIKVIRTQIVDEVRYNSEITKNEAKTIVQNMLEKHEEYTIKDGRQMNEAEINSYATTILRELVNHKWLSEKKTAYKEEDCYIFSKKGDILYQAMEKMAEPVNTYEYTNAVVSVYNACAAYNDGKIPPEKIYLEVLKLAYDTTRSLKSELFGESNELSNLIKEVSKHETAKDLVDYMLGVIYGNEFANFYRLINDKGDFRQRNQKIVDTFDNIASRIDDCMVASYREAKGREERTDDEIKEEIDNMISEIRDFYSYEYDNITVSLNRTITKWFQKAKARLDLFNNRSTRNEVTAAMMRLLMKQVESDYAGECDDSVTMLLNLYDTKVLTENSLYRFRQEKVTETKSDEEKEDIIFEIDEALELLNTKSDRDMRHTLEYLENLFGNRKVIEARNFNIRNKKDYLRLIDVLQYAMSTGFQYEIEFDFENTITYENAECTNFRLIRKETI